MMRLPTALRFLASAVALTLCVLFTHASDAMARSPATDGDGAAIAVPASPSAVPAKVAALRINEFMASNDAGLEDPDEPGEFPDWIEIYNPGSTSVDLNGVAFSDDEANPLKSPITSTLMIPANGFLVLYADDDGKQGPAHLVFKLSAGGETIGMYWAATSEQIDFHEFGAQTTNVSEGRKPDGSGAWLTLSAPSPGASNSQQPPVIGAVARSITQPQPGDAVDVTAEVTDNLPGFSVTLVYSTTSTSLQELPMTDQGGGVYKATLPAAAISVFVSYFVRAVDTDNLTTESDRSGYVVGYVKPDVVINELVADNVYVEGSPTNIEDEDDPGEYPDWAELYNPGASPVSLNGLFLTDNPSEPTKYRIPNGLTIPAKGYMLFWLDDDSEQGPRHASFALNNSGESLSIYGAEGTVVIDSITFGKQGKNIATGRYPDGGQWRTLYYLTPRKANVVLANSTYLPTSLNQK